MRKLRNGILLVMTFIMGLNSYAAKHSIERIEPPMWWSGMTSENLQILVYGKNISELNPVVEYKGVTIQKVSKVKSPNYLFIDLKLSKNLKPGKASIKFLKGKKAKFVKEYEFLARVKNSKLREGFDSSDAMYLITPDRFVNGDESNDEVKEMADKPNRSEEYGRHGGDLAGVIKSLDYIHDMGFTAIWLNPVIVNDMPQHSYHGYAMTDLYKIDPRYGTNEDYKKLCTLAADKGIKIIMDVIPNHIGSKHWWMNDLPTNDWLNYQESFKVTSHKRTVNMDIYASESDKKVHSDGWFVESMPDLNQKNPLLAEYLIQNTIWWIEYAGLQGLRIDTYPYPDKNFITEYNRRVLEEYPNMNLVGEEWSTNPVVVSYWQKGNKTHDGYVSYLPSLFDFPIQATLVSALKENESWGTGLIKLYEMLANDFLYADPNNLVTFPDNHDMSRIFTQLNEDVALTKIAIAYILTIRGIPQIYYGTEILAANPNSDSHGEIRSDFPGGWKGDKVNAFTGEGLTKDQKNVQNFTKKLLNYRKNNPVLHNSKLKHFAPKDGIYVYFRYNKDKTIMVVINKNDKEIVLDTERFSEVINGKNMGKNILTGKNITINPTMKLVAKSVTILEL